MASSPARMAISLGVRKNPHEIRFGIPTKRAGSRPINPDNKLGQHVGQFIARDRVHVVAMTGSYFRGDAEAVLAPQDEAKFDTVKRCFGERGVW